MNKLGLQNAKNNFIPLQKLILVKFAHSFKNKNEYVERYTRYFPIRSR
jgi:hypothetical protein